MSRLLHTVLVVAIGALTAETSAQEAYFRVRVSQLEITEGALPAWDELSRAPGWRVREKTPYAVLDGPGEVYLSAPAPGRATPDWTVMQSDVVVRVDPARDVTGTLFLPTPDGREMSKVRFVIAQRQADAEARRAFFEAKSAHYERLLAQDVPGAAWFRYQARLARQALGTADSAPSDTLVPRTGRPRAAELADTYALFTGGRAMSENLQLDRVLRADARGEQTVELESLEGITVREIDWKPLIEGLQVELDPLAAWIPADQHAIFFPSFAAAVTMADEIAQQGGLILQLAEPRSTHARTWERYERQMCLSISGVARLVGPSLVKSVAVTGSDTYFRTGTDVAVLLETENPRMLEDLLFAQVRLHAPANGQLEWLEGNVDGVAYRGARSADREVSCYLAKTDSLVVVANSLHPLRQLTRVMHNPTASLAHLDEYRFFRHRYDRVEASETAFVFLSDATIRRWCGPRWRIATSRRTRDAAILAELQASQLDRLVEGNVSAGPIYTDLPVSGGGQFDAHRLGRDVLHNRLVGLPDPDRGNGARAGHTARSDRLSAMARSLSDRIGAGRSIRSGCESASSRTS
jgi:hypothetical protein